MEDIFTLCPQEFEKALKEFQKIIYKDIEVSIEPTKVETPSIAKNFECLICLNLVWEPEQCETCS